MGALESFLGKWLLVAERSDYQLGQPPQEGSYTLIQEPEQIKVVMKWVTVEGKSMEQFYYAVPDGKDYPYHDNPAVDSMSMTLVGDTQLDSTAKKGEQLLSYASRELLEDGNLMKVKIITYLPNGTFTNTAYYARER